MSFMPIATRAVEKPQLALASRFDIDRELFTLFWRLEPGNAFVLVRHTSFNLTDFIQVIRVRESSQSGLASISTAANSAGSVPRLTHP